MDYRHKIIPPLDYSEINGKIIEVVKLLNTVDNKEAEAREVYKKYFGLIDPIKLLSKILFKKSLSELASCNIDVLMIVSMLCSDNYKYTPNFIVSKEDQELLDRLMIFSINCNYLTTRIIRLFHCNELADEIFNKYSDKVTFIVELVNGKFTDDDIVIIKKYNFASIFIENVFSDSEFYILDDTVFGKKVNIEIGNTNLQNYQIPIDTKVYYTH